MFVLFVSQPTRTLDSTSGADKQILYNVRRTEKGDKVVSTTEVLLELPLSIYISSMMDEMKQDEPVKDLLHKVLGEDAIKEFKTHFWGEVCTWTESGTA